MEKEGKWDVGGKGDIRDINDGSRRCVGLGGIRGSGWS